jgi:hypothetical protein
MWLQAMRERNYLHANDIYLRLAIGNAPWPIGVTSVGIHERSAREKISHVANGQAHIMNDEATRKYLQVTLWHNWRQERGAEVNLMSQMHAHWLCPKDA